MRLLLPGLFLLAFALSTAAEPPGAPPFSGKTLTGELFSFEPDRMPRPALTVFWASWCKECRYEFHELKKLSEETLGRLDIIGVTIDKDASKAAALSERAALPYASVIDSDAIVATLYDVRATPTLVLVDQSGKIRHVGHRVNADLRDALRGVLGKL